MTIQVRVLSAAALAQLRALEAQSKKTAVGVGAVGRQAAWGLPYLSKWGNQVQWAGRQLMYNFTLPIAIAMGAAAKFALENEKAMVRVEKVYGDGSKRFDRLAKTEIPALGEAFEALSNKFGVHQKQVIEIAGDWAAAGASGTALAKSVKITLETMILGELEAADATQQLIAIQAQYGQSTRELADTISVLNMVENQTGISMKGLMEGMARSAGVARTAGVTIEELSAMMAALTPATGSATTAGNGLKTMISRILSPTQEATRVMRLMGVEVDAMSWQGLTATERLQAMADQFDTLSSAQQAHVSTVMASRWQINRFVTLLRDMNNENGYYQKSLRSTADEQAIFAQKQYELNRVLTSNPQALKQTWVILQNTMAKVLVPLLPYIVYLAQQLTMLIQKFTDLSPEVQKLTLAGLLFLAAIGPIARYVGSISNLIGLLAAAFHFLTAKLLLVLAPLKLVRFLLLGLFKPLLLLPKVAALAAVGIGKVFGATLVASLVAPLRGVLLGPMIAAFTMMVTRLRIIWAAFGASMVVFTSVFMRKMAVVMTASFAAFRAIWTAGVIAIAATWGWLRSAVLVSTAALGMAMSAAWTVFMTGIHRLTVAGSILISATWTLLSRTMVAISAAMALSVKKIWIGMLAMTAGAIKGLQAFAIGAVLVGRNLMMAIVIGASKLAPLLLRVIAGPIGLAVMAALGVVYAFRDKIADAWEWIVQTFHSAAAAMPEAFRPVGDFFNDLVDHIVNAFWALPEGITNALIAVVRVIRTAALTVYEWMSYLNPFARHSPSLVESVTKGMDVIEAQYRRAAGLGGIFAKAARDLAAFKKQAGKGGEFADDRKKVVKSGGNVKLFDSMHGTLNKLYPILARQEAAVNRQEKVVDRWAKKLDNVNDRLEVQRNKLDRLQSKLDTLNDRYAAHEAALQAYATAPLKGMGEMEDAIFANELAQKKLRLEMLKWEEANGSVDSLRDRLAMLMGDIETMRGRLSDLRSAGAGSEITGPIEAQIAAMEAQARALQGAADTSPMAKMQSEMDKLQREGEIKQLEYDIKFDPLTREIDKLANAQKELSFNEIINGINRERAAMEALRPKIEEATRAVEEQEKVIDRIEKVKDRLSEKYDKEQDQLAALRDSYQKTAEVIRDLEAALRDMGQAAGAKLADAAKKAKAAKPDDTIAEQTFKAGEGANWADPGGFAKIGREGGMGDQSARIRALAEKWAGETASMMGDFDLFGPIKRGWSKVWGWIEKNVGPIVSRIGEGLKSAWESIPNPFGEGKNSSLVRGATKVWDTVADVFVSAWNGLTSIFDLFKPDLIRIWDALVEGAKRAWEKVGPELAKFGDLFTPLIDAFQMAWQVIKPLVTILGVILLGVFKVLASVISHTFGPILNMLIDVFAGVIRVIRGVIQFVLGVFTLDWRLAWKGIVDIFGGIWDTVIGVVEGIGKTLWGIVKGIVVGIWEFFVWLWDVLVGHSIVPDIVNGILDVFEWLADLPQWVWDNVLKPVWDFFVDLYDDVMDTLSGWWDGITKAWSKIKSGISNWWTDNVWKPLKKTVTDAWQAVKDSLNAWWEGIKNIWSRLKQLGRWVWDNVLKPVWDWFKDLWSDYVKPALQSWWEGIKNVWAALKGAAVWVWENVLKPIWQKVKDLWSLHVKPALAGWWEGIKNVWDRLTKLPGWIWDNVMKPIKDKFVEGWNSIKEWFEKNAGIILTPIRSVTNKIVDAINWIIKGLNKLSNLPGLSFHIDQIPEPFAQGGPLPSRRVAGGFKTNGARAIVGEGKANYPEYVIPTDPTYRNRARNLLQAAGQKIGMAGIPMHAKGGILGKVKDAFGSVKDFGKGALDWLGDKAKQAASKLFEPLAAIARGIVNKVDWPIGRKVGHGAIDLATDWVKAADKAFEEKMGKVAPAPGQTGSFPVQGGDWERIYWRGHQFNVRTVRMIQAAEKILGQAFHITQGSYSTSVAASGSTHAGGGVFDATSPISLAGQTALRQAGFAAWIRSPSQGPWPYHYHAVALGDKTASPAAQWQMQSYLSGGIGLAKGAVVRAKYGGTQATIGEGRNDEAVIPLPRNWRTDVMQSGSGGGDTIIQINGDLEFPNIKTGEDAEVFIANLKSLAGGAA